MKGKAEHKGRSSGLLRQGISVLLISLPLPLPAAAGEITDFVLEREGSGYHLRAKALIAAPVEGVWHALTDYPALKQVSSRIVESELVSVSPDGVARVRTLNRLCFLVFCRNIKHVQLIRELGQGTFESDSVPEESDLSYGHARWRLFDEGGDTRLDIDFRFAMESYSWVPSWVSRAVAGSVLKADAAELVQGIERTVRHRREETNER
jgi:hypothetical protein